ncbi:sensor histidine kinase [Ancylomarina longa]|uniref:Sensory/regulatory protein RpfC n=1 Tax=Ancylomarina longa TaxID=2487017 RepID=A0A434AGN8_9BACT|nr:ABC transporter substrate binding protein [Ancylomarina longa]RUT73552.1 hypothetical protein DLK05_12660 [Ancylomarina longa]
MRAILQKVFLPFFFVLICFSVWASNQKNILVLNSYHNGLSWTDSIVNSIKEELSVNPDYNIYIEDMDTKRNFSEVYFQILKQFYTQKYQNQKFDLIISTDNNAYNFLVDNLDAIFGKVPVLFCGLNSIINPPKGYSGIFENLDFSFTMNLIKKNHPKYSELVVVTDYSATERTTIQFLKKSIDQMKIPLRYRILKAANISELKSKLVSLDPNSVLLYLAYNRDAKGNYCTYEKGFEAVEPYCKIPIYCVWDFYMNRGAIGGALITGRMQGKQVSDMAKLVLNGTSVDDLPPQLAKYEYVFDYRQLKKYQIKKNTLPNNSKILNVPFSFVRENKDIVILTLTILVLLTIIIIVLTINNHLRKMREQRDKTHLIEIKASNKKLEKAIEIAEESNRLKSAFLANMSHEIRTPMNAILGFTELLSADDLESTKRKRFISIIKKNTNGLLRLISDILDISKIETNQIKIIKSNYRLNELFETLKTNYFSLLEHYGNSHLEFKMTLPESTDIEEISTDYMRLQQIFTNLLENSIKFTHSGGIEIGYQVSGKYLEFFVRDTGIGISEEKQEIIFDRFRQAELDANTRQYGGTGLGLAISKSLVELLGGQIWIRSKLGEGTTFYFTIPY